MADVFISYARALPGPKLQLESDLWREGYSTWSDAELNAGETFEQVIIANVVASKAVVTIWSPPALKSRWVPYESKLALDEEKLVCAHTKDINPAKDLPPDFYGEQSALVTDFPSILNALTARNIRPDGRTEADLPDSERIQREATREWLNGIEVTDDLALLRDFLQRYQRAPTIREMVKRRIALLEAKARSHDKVAADMLERAMVRSEARSFRNFLDEFDGDETELTQVAAERFVELDPDGFLEFTAKRAPALYAAPRLNAEQEVRRRDTPPEAATLRLNPAMHTAVIKRISLTADGAVMASASDDKTVKLWALPEGDLKRTLRPPIGEGDEGKVYAVAIDPAGRWVAAGGWMSEFGTRATFVTVFDTETGAVRARLGPLPNVVNDLEISPDGTRLAAGLGGQNGIRIWDTADWQEMPADRDYAGDVYGLTFAADGRLATTSYDGQIRLYGPDGDLIRTAAAPGGEQPHGIAFCPGGERLAIGYDGTTGVDVLDAVTLQRLYSAKTSGVTGGDLSKVAWLDRVTPALAAGGIYSGGGKCPLFVWEDAGKGPRTAWPGPGNTIMDLAPHPGGGLALASGEPSLALYSADGARLLNKPPEIADLRGKRFEHFTVSPDGLRLRFALEEWSDTPVLFDLEGRAISDAPSPVADLSPAETDSFDIQGWEDTTTPTLTRKTGLLRKDTSTPLALKDYERARSLAIAPDAASFILGTEWYLRRFDGAGRQIWASAVPGVVWGVNLARQGRLILAAYGDGTIRWHRAEDGTEVLALFIHLPDGPKGTAPQDRDWILWTPDGYYDVSSQSAEDLIGWHVNRGPDEAADFYPAETFAETFYRPDKVSAALDGV